MKAAQFTNAVNKLVICLLILSCSSFAQGAPTCAELLTQSNEVKTVPKVTYHLEKNSITAIEEIYPRRFAAEKLGQPDRFQMNDYFRAPLKEIIGRIAKQEVSAEFSALTNEFIAIGRNLLKEKCPYGPTIRYIYFAAVHLFDPKLAFKVFARQTGTSRSAMIDAPDLVATIYTGLPVRGPIDFSHRGLTLDQLIADRTQILIPTFDNVSIRRMNRLSVTPFKVLGLNPLREQDRMDVFMDHDIGHTASLTLKTKQTHPLPTDNAQFLAALVERAKQGNRFLDLVEARFTGGQSILANGYIFEKTHEQVNMMKDLTPLVSDKDPDYMLIAIANEGVKIPTDMSPSPRESLIEMVNILMQLHRQVYAPPAP